MAAPRVFISSTCYDLAAERDSLSEFCAGWGFDTTLSERGDIFYHPDLHTHDSCVRETSNCQLFVLIIGGRFGGNYIVDPVKSITNAEYSAAVKNGTPVFAFVKQDVLNDHHLWQRNKDKPFSQQITYPSIDKQSHAIDIFNFIDEVRNAPTNNGLFGFRLAKDISNLLRRQWAGMMFDYLQMRSVAKQIAITNEAIGNIAVVSSKIEELVKKIYINVDSTNATQEIQTIDIESQADEFMSTIASRIGDRKFVIQSILDSRPDRQLPANWWEFVIDFSACELVESETPNNAKTRAIADYSKKPIVKIDGPMSKEEEIDAQELQAKYLSLLRMSKTQQRQLLEKYLWTTADSERVRERAKSKPAS